MILIAGFLFMVLMFVVTGVFSGTLLSFIDIPSALLILLPLAFFLAVSKSGAVMGRYLAAGFKKAPAMTRPELKALSAAAGNAVRLLLGAGAFGSLTGIIASLAYLNSGERLGPNLAVSLLTLLYAAALAFFVFLPVAAWAENKQRLLPQTGSPSKP